MKRSFIHFLIISLCVVLCLCLFSCGDSPNMSTLLSYQKAGTTFHILINGKTKASVTLGEETAVTLKNDEFSSLTYRFSADKVTLSNGELSVPLGSDRHIEAKKWAELFALPCDIPWHIEKVALDGKTVYRCRTEGMTLHIALDGTPLRVESGDATVTVLGVS